MTSNRIGRTVALLLTLALLVAVPGCGDSHESLADESVDHMEDLVKILKGITDEDSAESASSDLEEWAEDMKDLGERVKKLEDLGAEEEKKMEEKYKDKFTDVGSAVGKEMMRIGMDAKLRPHVQKAFEAVKKAMMSME